MNRPYTSRVDVKDLRRPDRRMAVKVLVKKTFHFADHLWCCYLTLNKSDVRCVPCTLIVRIVSHIEICLYFRVLMETSNSENGDDNQMNNDLLPPLSSDESDED